MDDYNDLSGELVIKDRLSNKITGKYKLYNQTDNTLDSQMVVMKPDEGSLNSVLYVRTQKNIDLPASLQIMYRGNDYVDSTIEAVAGEYLEASIEVRPFNRLFGKFELLEAPKKEVQLTPLADASTRSRSDLRTINYGDTKSMLTGQNEEEHFESFVYFGDIESRIPDIKLIQSAKIRLYYINFIQGSNLELHQPNTIWREMGITDANKPYSLQLLSETYTINTNERYIEFDLLDIVDQWQSEQLLNYGLIIKTQAKETFSFYTRESQKSPQLIIKYITSQIYSMGRTQIDASMFVYGKGYKDITGQLTVHSDYGIEYLESSLYVHRYESPMYEDKDSNIGISRPEVNGQLTVYRRENDDSFEGLLSVANKISIDSESTVNINIPDMHSELNLDPNAFLKSNISIRCKEYNELVGSSIVSQPDFGGTITVSNYKRTNNDLEGILVIKTVVEQENESQIAISKPDLHSEITIRAYGENSLDSSIDIPFYSNADSTIITSTPDLPASMLIKYMNQIDAEIIVKERSYLDSVIDIRQINELSATIDIKQINEKNAKINVSVPDLCTSLGISVPEVDSELWIKYREFLETIIDVKQISELSGFLIAKQINEKELQLGVNIPDLAATIQPRLLGMSELDVLGSIRKRDASDLNSSILIRGKSNGSYWFIF